MYIQTIWIEFQLQIGGKSFPQMPTNSISESWSQLRKAVAAYGKHPLSTKAREYHSTKFVHIVMNMFMRIRLYYYVNAGLEMMNLSNL